MEYTECTEATGVSTSEIVAKESGLEDILRRIEDEPPQSVRARERNAFDKIAGEFSQKLVLFGAAQLGKIVLDGLRRSGIEPVAFADNNQKLWGKEVAGVPVLSPSEAAEKHSEAACFVVTAFQGSAIRRQLTSLGCQRVAPFASLFWKYPDVFIPQLGIDLPHRLAEHFEAIRACNAGLADEKSKEELREQLVWRWCLDYSALSLPLDGGDTYFPLDLIEPLRDEVFVDCGSFQGDTILTFISHWNDGFRHIFAVEPDPLNRDLLVANAKGVGVADRVTVMPYAVGSENGLVPFDSTGTVTSQIVQGRPGSSVECRRLDETSWPVPPTYIKMDIEGAEPEALIGATELLRRQQPVLAVCTYHRSEHLWQIPNLIRSIAPEYNLFLRRYAEECWEGVCYAIPTHRWKRC